MEVLKHRLNSGILLASAVVVAPALAVGVADETELNAEIQASVKAGVRIDADNNIYTCDKDGVYSVSQFTYVLNGTTGDVWVERTINSGSLDTDGIGATRVVCSTDRTLEVEDTTDNGSPRTANVTVSFYDASSGGNLMDTATFSLSAERLGV